VNRSGVATAWVLGATLVALGACGLDWSVVPDGSGGQGSSGGNGRGGATGSGGDGLGAGATSGSGASGGSPAGSTVSAGGAGSSSTAASSSTGPVPCDASATCDACDTCAINRGCSALWNQCISDPDCDQLDSCIFGECDSLGDIPCINFCFSMHPLSGNLYDQLMACILCDECPMTCARFTTVWGCI
jgi:hypothetical protein